MGDKTSIVLNISKTPLTYVQPVPIHRPQDDPTLLDRLRQNAVSRGRKISTQFQSKLMQDEYFASEKLKKKNLKDRVKSGVKVPKELLKNESSSVVGAQRKRKFDFDKSSNDMPVYKKLMTRRSANQNSEEVFDQKKFSALPGLHPHLVDRLENENGFGFKFMSSIQALAIPEIMSGRDCFVKSQTGSGKTLAYAVPVVQKLSEIEPKINRRDGPYAVILTPTRELTLQSYDVLEKLLKAFIWIVPGYFSGGEKRKSEKARLRKNINVLVATPGRLIDHLKNTSNLILNRVRFMIYDEADRLLDGGFENDIKHVIELLNQNPVRPQSILVSATLNSRVQQLIALALTDPVMLTPNTAEANGTDGLPPVGDDQFAMPASLLQLYVVTPTKQRLVTLIALIFMKFKYSKPACQKMLIFFNTMNAVDFHYYVIDYAVNGDDPTERDKIEMFRLHGNMTQQERTAVYKKYSSAAKGVLLATDVAARGLHIPHLDCIVQYNSPGSATEYIHRVGRTARMGNSGTAVLFLQPSEFPYLDVLNEKHSIFARPIPQNEILRSLRLETGMPHLQEAMHEIQRRCESLVYSRTDVHEMGQKAYVSMVRSYASYPANLKHIFNVKSMHLGHLAKCFALREAPTEIAKRSIGFSISTNPAKKAANRQKSEQRALGQSSRIRTARPQQTRRMPVNMSEFGNGFDSIH